MENSYTVDVDVDWDECRPEFGDPDDVPLTVPFDDVPVVCTPADVAELPVDGLSFDTTLFVPFALKCGDIVGVMLEIVFVIEAGSLEELEVGALKELPPYGDDDSDKVPVKAAADIVWVIEPDCEIDMVPD